MLKAPTEEHQWLPDKMLTPSLSTTACRTSQRGLEPAEHILCGAEAGESRQEDLMGHSVEEEAGWELITYPLLSLISGSQNCQQSSLSGVTTLAARLFRVKQVIQIFSLSFFSVEL